MGGSAFLFLHGFEYLGNSIPEGKQRSSGDAATGSGGVPGELVFYEESSHLSLSSP